MPQPRVEQRAPRLSLRLRGTSFDRYDGRRWTRSASPALRLPRFAPFVYPIRRLPQPGYDRQLQIVLDHLEEPVVFLPEGTVALSVPPRVSSGESLQRELSHSAGLDVRYDNPDGMGLIYTAFVSRDPAENAIVPIAEEHRADYLQMPPGHERVVELAKRVAGDAADDQQKAERVERFLKRGAYTYSLVQPDVGKRWPLEAFLFDEKRGHCEYYSSAMAIMLRAISVPTRNVTGFVGGQFNPYGNYYALRQGDAHSWVEVYVKGRGWVTFDPTPTSRADAGPRSGLWSDLNALIDAIRTRWMTSVVGYDLRAQVGLLHKIGRLLAALRGSEGQSASDRMHGAHGLGVHLGRAFLLRALAGVLLAGLFVWLLIWALRPPRTAAGRLLSKQQAQAVGLYLELERALGKRGHARPPSLTPLEHARQLRELGFAQQAEVDRVTRGYLEARYGGRPLRTAEVVELRDAIARVRRSAA
jgi:transglutaminase-like putative cysteine protease